MLGNSLSLPLMLLFNSLYLCGYLHLYFSLLSVYLHLHHSIYRYFSRAIAIYLSMSIYLYFYICHFPVCILAFLAVFCGKLHQFCGLKAVVCLVTKASIYLLLSLSLSLSLSLCRPCLPGFRIFSRCWTAFRIGFRIFSIGDSFLKEAFLRLS